MLILLDFAFFVRNRLTKYRPDWTLADVAGYGTLVTDETLVEELAFLLHYLKRIMKSNPSHH